MNKKEAPTILLGHGSGGKLTHQLISEIFLPHLRNAALEAMEDSARFQVPATDLAFTTDSYVVDPIFFPGGDIGKLAICGTVNDLAVCGATPVCLSAGFILEEGFPVEQLKQILSSMKQAAAEAGVNVITGDTKVVPRTKADKIYINTAGVGCFMSESRPAAVRVEAGDAILINGPIGDHGIAVMAAREKLSLPAAVQSDCAPLASMVQALFSAGLTIHAMRDPTRGGVATTLNEIAGAAGVEIEIFEAAVPVRGEVTSACEIMGFDPLYLPNEGKLLAFVPAEQASAALDALRAQPLGRDARLIGRVIRKGVPRVIVRTEIGGRRILDMMVGEQLPRIC